MIKQDLIQIIAERSGCSDMEAKRMLDAATDAMTEVLTKGETVILRGFGTFKVKTRAPKVVRDINTGEQFTMPARRVVVFEPGKELKDI